MKTVYTFPNGYGIQAHTMFGRLANVNLHPVWHIENTEDCILLPDDEVSLLEALQECDPAVYGNPKKKE